ncbi:hypothetical protein L1887_46637 [Cichorium endivia]|nr:hypothetical protein L1887_46637 [Cichorium endivia]
MDGAALVGCATGNDGFVDIRVNRDFFAGVSGRSHKIWPARLQIYGHADQMPTAGFGVTNQAFQLQIGFLCYALVLHPDIQAKRARRLAGLPPFNDADQKAERLHHTPHSAGCALVLMDIESILHHTALHALSPSFVPAINRKGPRQIRQKLDRACCRVP